MSKEKYGKACKICERPFTVYRWQPGSSARYKKTELCATCAKLKNVCQTCVLDLEYGLPVQVRDSALEEHERLRMPSSDVNREYLIEQYEKDADGITGRLSYGKINSQPSEMLEKLARRAPYYKRNLPHLCSFHAKGACSRGALCPFRHEMPITGELANQNIKDRFYGQNDPVAKKLMNRYKTTMQPKLDEPEDKSITTLWAGGLDAKVVEDDVRSKFVPFGVLSSVTLLPAKGCAFVTYLHRSSAEEAAKNLANNLMIRGKSCRIAWGKKARGPASAAAPGGAPAAGEAGSAAAAGPAAIKPTEPSYPSQDPHHMAAVLAHNLERAA